MFVLLFPGFCWPVRNTLTPQMDFLVQVQGPLLAMDLADKRAPLGTLKKFHGMVKHLHALEEIIYFCLILILSTLVSKKKVIIKHTVLIVMSPSNLSPQNSGNPLERR